MKINQLLKYLAVIKAIGHKESFLIQFLFYHEFRYLETEKMVLRRPEGLVKTIYHYLALGIIVIYSFEDCKFFFVPVNGSSSYFVYFVKLCEEPQRFTQKNKCPKDGRSINKI